MTIPVYVVTGFLESGKTTFLNRMLGREGQNYNHLVIQFENGEIEVSTANPDCEIQVYSKRNWEKNPQDILQSIASYIETHAHTLENIWVEWNGMIPFGELYQLFLQPVLRKVCKIEKVVHIADAVQFESLLGRTGEALPEQIINSDLMIVRGVQDKQGKKKITKILKELNASAQVLGAEQGDEFLYKKVLKRKENPMDIFFLVILWGLVMSFFARPLLEGANVPLEKIATIFLGIILQAIPFLLIGVLLSSLIQIFVPQTWIENRFPKSPVLGMLVAVVAGFCLPVCDCASIPIFKSLVKKGVPLPAAITFMTASPVINPVVMISTYYAFGGNTAVMLQRVAFGIVCSLLIGICVGVWEKKKKTASVFTGKFDRIMCSCGCYQGAESVTGFKGKAELFVRHAQAEFFNVGKYLVIGTFIASIFQAMGSGWFTAMKGTGGLALSLAVMMLMAFLLSLCSSSDAVIGRSFANQFPMGAIMGFLVWGPMMDIKNMMMLSSGFPKRFVVRIMAVSAVVCYLIVFAVYSVGGI